MKKTYKSSAYSIIRIIIFHSLIIFTVSHSVYANLVEEKISRGKELEEIRQTFLEIQKELNILYDNGNVPEKKVVSPLNNIKFSEEDDQNSSHEINSDHRNPDNIFTSENSGKSYYFLIRPGFHILNDINLQFAHGPNGEIKTNSGYDLFFETGRKIGNLDLSIGVGFNNSELAELSWLNRKYSAHGEIDTYQFILNGNYNFLFNDHFSLRVGGGLGFASRHDHYEIGLLSPNSINERNLILTTQINFHIGFKITNSLSMITGYRFNYLGSSGSFGELFYNSFEVGMMWEL